ncbi:CBS domain-containing protein [Thermosulfurimonas marina]|uniref:CBS domain-containing protein n=1 Tax=Thermosulfurimonas marina TaxID=2047767 RepID=A0A6H1WRA2_9BACT|nr:CBS domain-containing protein [Thermosulfurimonas marina]QJA05745.1 CBS domain-containing protein [Thermosulfurimonas marina]
MDFTQTKVREVMSREVFRVPLEASLEEILRELLEHRIHAVLVSGPGGEFMGVVSHSDIIEALAKHGPRIFEMKAEDLMCPKPYTIEAEATLKEAAAKMIAHRVHRLLVVTSHGGKFIPVGVLSATDLVRAASL